MGSTSPTGPKITLYLSSTMRHLRYSLLSNHDDTLVHILMISSQLHNLQNIRLPPPPQSTKFQFCKSLSVGICNLMALESLKSGICTSQQPLRCCSYNHGSSVLRKPCFSKNDQANCPWTSTIRCFQGI